MNNEEIRYYLDNIINEINKNFEYYEKTSKKIDEYDQIRSTEKEIFITNYQTKSNLLKDSLESLKKECQQIIEQINLNNYNGEISNEVIKSAKEFKVKYDDFAKYNLGDIYFNYAKSTYDRIEQLIKESYNNINQPVSEQSLVSVENKEQSLVPTENLNQSLVPTENLNQSLVPAENLNQSLVPTENLNQSLVPTENLNQSLVPAENLNQSLVPTENKEQSLVPENEAKQEQIIREGKKPKAWLKALAGSAGFVAGVGLSVAAGSVPILGTAITIYTTARLVYNASKGINNIVTRHRAKKQTKKLEQQINDLTAIEPRTPEQEQQLIDNISEYKHIQHCLEKKNMAELKANPNIKTKITQVKEKNPKIAKVAKVIFDKPKNPYAKWFVNGASLGYLVGNMLNVKDMLESPQGRETSVTPSSGQAQENPITTPVPEISDMPEVGQTYDLSEVVNGYISSDSTEPLHMLHQIGEDRAIITASKVVDGRQMVHFATPDGDGYAWFPWDEIKNIIKEVATKAR